MERRSRKSEEGWTFMETLIVVAIVMVLSAGVGYMASGSLEKARVASAKAQIDSFCTALEMFYMDTGKYPSDEEGLEALWKKDRAESELWKGPYLYKAVPKDPWGNEYEYLTDEFLNYRIRSFGADGREGGEGKNKDITSWEN
jgi:general secretion pathway protein G